MGNTYILCQIKDGLLLLDQHAAHERIIYENLKKGLENSRLEIQNLLIPHRVELSATEKAVVLEKGTQLTHYGIELDHFGGNTFVLRAVPAYLKDVHWDVFVSELINTLKEGRGEDEFSDKVLALVACHGALRAGHPLTPTEMRNLLTQLDEMDLPTNCPHGRPIFRRFTYRELEKMFKRVV